MCLLGLHRRRGISAGLLTGALHGPHDILISSRVSLTTLGRCLDWCFQWRSLPNSPQPTAEPCRRHLDAVHGPRGLSPSIPLPPFHGAHRVSHGVANDKQHSLIGRRSVAATSTHHHSGRRPACYRGGRAAVRHHALRRAGSPPSCFCPSSPSRHLPLLPPPRVMREQAPSSCFPSTRRR